MAYPLKYLKAKLWASSASPAAASPLRPVPLMQLVQRPQGQIVEGAIRFDAGDKVYNIAKTPTNVMETIRGNKILHDFSGTDDELSTRCFAWMIKLTKSSNFTTLR